MFRLFLCFLLSPFFAFSESAEAVIKAQTSNNLEAKNSQKKISETDQITEDLISKYRDTLKNIEAAKVYNEQLRKLIESQKTDEASITQEIREIKNTDKKIVPLMLEMLEGLDQFVNLDLPFNEKERKDKVSYLKKIMDRADVTTAEKYRQILDFYKTEYEYGRTVNIYRGSQNIEGKELTVEFLQIGRVSLIYQTLDGSKQAYWSQAEKKWIPIPSKFQKEVSKSFKIAAERIAPDLITVWVKAPTKEAAVKLKKNNQIKENPVKEEKTSEDL